MLSLHVHRTCTARARPLRVLLQACPAQLHANLQYISRFRHPSKLVSEAAYYLTHMQVHCPRVHRMCTACASHVHHM